MSKCEVCDNHGATVPYNEGMYHNECFQEVYAPLEMTDVRCVEAHEGEPTAISVDEVAKTYSVLVLGTVERRVVVTADTLAEAESKAVREWASLLGGHVGTAECVEVQIEE